MNRWYAIKSGPYTIDIVVHPQKGDGMHVEVHEASIHNWDDLMVYVRHLEKGLHQRTIPWYGSRHAS